MSNFRLKEVVTKRDEIAFLDVVTPIYEFDKNWVRPLDKDIKAVFNAQKNTLFDQGEAIRWILYDDKNIAIGRIAAFYNSVLASKGYCKAGGCGFFECIDSQEAANQLFDACSQWLAQRGIQAMDGPINFGERDQFWGVLVDGFHHPMYRASYNRPYYAKLFEQYGFQVYFNQYSYLKELNMESLNSTVLEKAKRLKKNPEFEFRPIRKDEIDNMAVMFREVYNKAWINFDDIAEITVEQSESVVKMLKPIIDLNILTFAFHLGVPIGFFICIPDINMAVKGLNGSISSFNLLKFIYKFKIKKVCNIIQGIAFGVVPEFQGKGIESGMILSMLNTVNATDKNRKKYKHLEITWIGDFNPLMIRVIESYVCAIRYKHFVTYRYIIDKTVEFKRALNVSKTNKK